MLKYFAKLINIVPFTDWFSIQVRKIVWMKHSSFLKSPTLLWAFEINCNDSQWGGVYHTTGQFQVFAVPLPSLALCKLITWCKKKQVASVIGYCWNPSTDDNVLPSTFQEQAENTKQNKNSMAQAVFIL
jgi:hypothetical protein